MKTIWLMLMLMSSPNMPSVKYHALLYNTEGECMKSVVDYLNFYEEFLATQTTYVYNLCIQKEWN